MENLSATIKNSLDQIDGKFALNIVFCDLSLIHI